MKKTILTSILALLLCAPCYAKTDTVDTLVASTSGSVPARTKQVTFIFSATFTGTIAGSAFAGWAGADVPLTITAPDGDTLDAIPYTVTTGTLKIVRVGQ